MIVPKVLCLYAYWYFQVKCLSRHRQGDTIPEIALISRFSQENFRMPVQDIDIMKITQDHSKLLKLFANVAIGYQEQIFWLHFKPRCHSGVLRCHKCPRY